MLNLINNDPVKCLVLISIKIFVEEDGGVVGMERVEANTWNASHDMLLLDLVLLLLRNYKVLILMRIKC